MYSQKKYKRIFHDYVQVQIISLKRKQSNWFNYIHLSTSSSDIHIDKFLFLRTDGRFIEMFDLYYSVGEDCTCVCLVRNGFPAILYIDGKIFLWLTCKLWDRIRFYHILLCTLLLMCKVLRTCPNRLWSGI